MVTLVNACGRCCRALLFRRTTFESALSHLQAAGLDTPQNRAKIRSEASQQIVACLAAADSDPRQEVFANGRTCLTQENCDRLLVPALETAVASALSSWVINVCPQNLDLLFAKQENILDVCRVIQCLSEAELRNGHNLDIVSLDGNVAEGLQLMAHHGLLTQTNLDAVIAYPWMGTEFSAKMRELHSAGTLTQEQLDEFLHTDILDMELPQLQQQCMLECFVQRGTIKEQQCAIRTLRLFNILTPEHRHDLLTFPEKGLSIAVCYGYLSVGGILTPANKEALCREDTRVCATIMSGLELGFKTSSQPREFLAQVVTQDIFGRLLANPRSAPHVLLLMAKLSNAGLFGPQTPDAVFSHLLHCKTLVVGIEQLNTLNPDELAEMMADPEHAPEIAEQIVFGLTPEERKRLVQTGNNAVWRAHRAYAQGKSRLNLLLQNMHLNTPENLQKVQDIGLQDMFRMIVALRGLLLTALTMTQMQQQVDTTQVARRQLADGERPLQTQSFSGNGIANYFQQGFDAIVAHPQYALDTALLHVMCNARVPDKFHAACFKNPAHFAPIVQGMETLTFFQLFSHHNIEQFLSDEGVHIPAIAEALVQARRLDQQGFDEIVEQVKTGQPVVAQRPSSNSDAVLRRRPQHEIKV